MDAASIPAELRAMLDADAGRAHSADGPVLASLARILTRHDEIRSQAAPAASPALRACNLHELIRGRSWRGCGGCYDVAAAEVTRLRTELAEAIRQRDAARLCPSCSAQWLPGPAVVAHEDDCPSLRHRDCSAAATGFCACPPKPAPEPFRQPSSSGTRLGPWITASYDGECADCGRLVGDGDAIRADGEGGWLCGDCG
jgi:hypothetical protein